MFSCSIGLRPMLLMTMTCNVCGRMIREAQREEAADDDKLAEVSQIPSEKIIVQCPKCGQLTRNRKVVNQVLGRKVL